MGIEKYVPPAQPNEVVTHSCELPPSKSHGLGSVFVCDTCGARWTRVEPDAFHTNIGGWQPDHPRTAGAPWTGNQIFWRICIPAGIVLLIVVSSINGR